MGCQTSQFMKQSNEMRISIVDSSFMKSENDSIRKQMHEANILYDLFISMDCFFEQFANRYYNKIVVSYEYFTQLNARLRKLKFSPNIYVILDGKKIEENISFNIKSVEDYNSLIKCLEEKKNNVDQQKTSEKAKNKKNCDVKVLCKPGPRNSQQTVFEAALKKNQISYEFYNSFQVLEQSLQESESEYIVTNYIYHKQVLQLLKNKNVKIYCYCSFDKNQVYDSQLYSVSNNYLQIAADIKSLIAMKNKSLVKCTKVYIYTQQFQQYEQISNIVQDFGLESRFFNNIEAMIKETTYFFCVTVLAAQSQVKKLRRMFQQQGFLFRIKILGIPKINEPKIQHLFKTIREIKKGYYIQKSITYSIDIIDRHYDNIKFEQIKKQLQKNDINCFGYSNLSTFIKQKKLISPFIICNYQQRILLIKYLKQLQSKSKIIIFCNKNKIDSQLKNNKHFAFVSSHFGKIIKFIRKTLVFVPLQTHIDSKQIDKKIQNIKNKNRRISALKWSGQQKNSKGDQNQENFQFLNISKQTNNGSIRDILQSVSSLWKASEPLSVNMKSFRQDFVISLRQLIKIYKIGYPADKLNELLQKIKTYSISELLMKNKDFFQAQNQLGLEINSSLIKTESCDRNQIISMRQFLNLSFMNFFTGFNVPNIGIVKLKRWVSHGLIEKCQVGSYLFSKNFLIFYEDTPMIPQLLTPYKIQVQLQYNTLVEKQIFLNNFFTNKDKYVFCPFSQFQVLEIRNCGEFKTIVLKHIKNVDFLKYIYQENITQDAKNINHLVSSILQNPSKIDFIDFSNQQQVRCNLERCTAIQLFKSNKIDEAIEIHKKIKMKIQQQQNLNSSLVNQITYQIACFYLKNNESTNAANLMKQLMQSDPNQYIKAQCQRMIDDLTKQKDQEKDEENQRQGQNLSINVISCQDISSQAMKTFIWLKNQQQSQSSQSQQSCQIENIQIDRKEDTDFKCLEIDQFGNQFGQQITNKIR